MLNKKVIIESLRDLNKPSKITNENFFDFKKGGSTKRPSLPKGKSPRSYSRSFEATNRLFAQHPLFKKPKSKKNKIFDPRAQYYAEGGEPCSPGYIRDENGDCVWHDPDQENSVISDSPIQPVEYLRSQLTTGDPFYNTHEVYPSDEGDIRWQPKANIEANLRNTNLKKFIQRDPDEGPGVESGYLHNNIWTTPTLGLEQDTMEPGYAPNQLRYERDGQHPNVYFIKNSVDGSTQAPSGSYTRGWRPYQNKKLSGAEYNKAQNEVGQNLLKQGYKGENMWGAGDEEQLYQLYGTEGLTLKGATKITPETLKYLESIKDSEEGKRYLAKMAGISEDDPDYANMLMHYNTTPIDVYAKSSRPNYEDIPKAQRESDNTEETSLLTNREGPVNYANGGLIQYAPGGNWPPLKKGAVYVNPLYMGNFVGGNNSFDTLTGENATYDIYNPYSASSFNVGVQLPLSKNRRIDSEKTKGWMMDAYVGMPYSQMIGEDAKFLPSAGVKFDYENSPQNDPTYGFRKFRPFVNLGAEYSPTDGFGVGAFGGGRTPFGKTVKPGYGAGHMDAYAGFQGGLNLGKGNAQLSPIIGGRIKGEYEPNRKSFLNKVLGDDVSIFGEAGATANFFKGKMTQRETDDMEIVATGNNSIYEGPDFGTAEREIQSQPDSVGVGFDFYGNVGLKKKFSDFKSTKKNTADKRIQEIEDNEKRAFQESEVEKEEPKKEKPKKECPKGEMRYCADCPCEPIEKVRHPRWLEDGGLVQYEPGGYSDEPPGSKKKPYRDKNAILPRWMPDGMIKAIKNTEVGISPLMSNEQAYPMGMKKNFTDIATTGENLLGEGTGAMGVSNPAYGVNFTTGLTRDVSKNKDTGWALKGYLGKPYDSSLGKAAGAAIERIGQDTYDARWDEYNQNLAAYNAGTMPATMLYGEDGWDPEKNKPKYDGKLARGLGKAMQKSPLIGGLSAHYRYDKFKQPHGYKAAGEGEIKLDWDPSNNVGLGLKGGLEFYGGNKYHSKNYRPGAYKWNVNPSITGGIGTRPNFGFNVNAGLEGLPKFMPKNFPGYFYGNVNYNQSLLGPGSLSANAGMKFPLNDLKKRKAQKRIDEKQREDVIKPNIVNPNNVRTTTYGSNKNGGISVKLTDDEIKKYVDGGYIVEDDISVPELNQYAPGGWPPKSKKPAKININDYAINDIINNRTTPSLKAQLINKAITPIGYAPVSKFLGVPAHLIFGSHKPETYALKNRYDAWSVYNGLAPEYNSFELNSDGTLAVKNFDIQKSILDIIRDSEKTNMETAEFNNLLDGNPLNFGGVHGNGYISKGIDSSGMGYIDFTDKWDLQPFMNKTYLPKAVREFEVSQLSGGKPFELKNRIYFDNEGNYFNEKGEKLVETKQSVNKNYSSAAKQTLENPESNVEWTKEETFLTTPGEAQEQFPMTEKDWSNAQTRDAMNYLLPIGLGAAGVIGAAIKQINSNNKDKKYGGETDYELGDEVELTDEEVEELKKTGYTFEKIK
jgi:hypothetical protein